VVLEIARKVHDVIVGQRASNDAAHGKNSFVSAASAGLHSEVRLLQAKRSI